MKREVKLSFRTETTLISLPNWILSVNLEFDDKIIQIFSQWFLYSLQLSDFADNAFHSYGIRYSQMLFLLSMLLAYNWE
jgi:hypothetical protein